MKNILLACALVIVSTSAFAQSRDANEVPAGALAQSDVDFLKAADAANIDQLTLGKRAIGNPKNETVRSLAENVVRAHGKADDALRLLAAAKHVDLAHRQTAAGDEDADQLVRKDVPVQLVYAKGVARDGEALTSLYESALQSRDADIRKYADQMLPAVRDYTRQANDLLKRANVSE